RSTGKPVFLAVNKIDHQVVDDLVHEFHQLGLGEPYPISAAHGRGIDRLLESIVKVVSPETAKADDDDAATGDDSDDIFDVLPDDEAGDPEADDAPAVE